MSLRRWLRPDKALRGALRPATLRRLARERDENKAIGDGVSLRTIRRRNERRNRRQ